MSNSNLEAWIKEGIYKVGDRCNIEQYKMLIRCSEDGNISEWNNWQDGHTREEIWLAGANLRETNLYGAKLNEANLQGAKLWGANLQGARLAWVNLQGAELHGANLQGAELRDANLQGAWLVTTTLHGAKLEEANLQGVRLVGANLQGVELGQANLQGARFVGAGLQDMNCEFAIVDGETLITLCEINKNTNFTGVGLDSARIDPGLKQLLEYNIRRKRWDAYYRRDWKRRLLQPLVQPFWWMSDYGRSTLRIVGVFFISALVFACIYSIWTKELLTGVVDDGGIRGFIHTLYFSVVTMTTLGFGDISANPRSMSGQALLMVQVLLGYVLLGALITRLAILFTSDGPTAKTKYFKIRKTEWVCCKQMVRIKLKKLWKKLRRKKRKKRE